MDRILRQTGINNFGREADIFIQQHEFFEQGMQEYRDFIRRFFQQQALGYQRYFDDLQVEQIEQIFIDSENMIFEIENIFNQMIEGEPVNQNLASEIVQQFQINREIKTFKDLEKNI